MPHGRSEPRLGAAELRPYVLGHPPGPVSGAGHSPPLQPEVHVVQEWCATRRRRRERGRRAGNVQPVGRPKGGHARAGRQHIRRCWVRSFQRPLHRHCEWLAADLRQQATMVFISSGDEWKLVHEHTRRWQRLSRTELLNHTRPESCRPRSFGAGSTSTAPGAQRREASVRPIALTRTPARIRPVNGVARRRSAADRVHRIPHPVVTVSTGPVTGHNQCITVP